MIQIRVRSERRILRAEMSCAPAVAARNISAVVDVQFNQAAGKRERTMIAAVCAIGLLSDGFPAE
jgi:hypothetical protein